MKENVSYKCMLDFLSLGVSCWLLFTSLKHHNVWGARYVWEAPKTFQHWLRSFRKPNNIPSAWYLILFIASVVKSFEFVASTKSPEGNTSIITVTFSSATMWWKWMTDWQKKFLVSPFFLRKKIPIQTLHKKHKSIAIPCFDWTATWLKIEFDQRVKILIEEYVTKIIMMVWFDVTQDSHHSMAPFSLHNKTFCNQFSVLWKYYTCSKTPPKDENWLTIGQQEVYVSGTDREPRKCGNAYIFDYCLLHQKSTQFEMSHIQTTEQFLSGHFLPIFWPISYKFFIQIFWILIRHYGQPLEIPLLIFLVQVPQIGIPWGRYSFFLAQVLPTFLWIFPFDLVISNIDMLHPFMVAWYYHATKWLYCLQLWYMCHFVDWCIKVSLWLVSPFYLLHSLIGTVPQFYTELNWSLHYALHMNEVKRWKEFDGRNYELFYMTTTLPPCQCHISG